MSSCAFSIVQSISTLILGMILGLIFIWKLGLVGLGMFAAFVYLVFCLANEVIVAL